MAQDEGGAGPVAKKLRAHRVSFRKREKLWRTIGPRDLAGPEDKKKVKPQSLRLQISVDREDFRQLEDVRNEHDPSRNGVAELHADEAAACAVAPIQIFPVDEPLKANEAHSLIALVSALDANATEEDESETRIKLSVAMRVVRGPVKPTD